LNVRLLDRDLLIVGYWTDWDYLNEILAATLGAVNPARVIVVDLADRRNVSGKGAGSLRARAACVDGLSACAGFRRRLPYSLRCHFSKSFVRRVLHLGANEYSDYTGSNPDAAWIEPRDLDNITLWQIPRDLEGRMPNEPAKERKPAAESLVGLTLLQLQACGDTRRSCSEVRPMIDILASSANILTEAGLPDVFPSMAVRRLCLKMRLCLGSYSRTKIRAS
jgi:hypothetical protein